MSESTDQLAAALESHFRVTAFGLAATNPQIPTSVMLEAIAKAMGYVIGGATKTPDLATTIHLRGELQDAFSRALRMRYPAVDQVPAAAPEQPMATAPASDEIAASETPVAEASHEAKSDETAEEHCLA